MVLMGLSPKKSSDCITTACLAIRNSIFDMLTANKSCFLTTCTYHTFSEPLISLIASKNSGDAVPVPSRPLGCWPRLCLFKLSLFASVSLLVWKISYWSFVGGWRMRERKKERKMHKKDKKERQDSWLLSTLITLQSQTAEIESIIAIWKKPTCSLP